MKEKFGPCLDKNCSYCCDPIKVNATFPIDKIPKDRSGKPLWEEENLLTSKECPDGTKIKTFRCKNFNKDTGLCNDYEDRPDICKNTSCIKEESDKSVDEQHKETLEEKFILIK